MAQHDSANGKSGFFITFEGGEGAGKSSQIGTLADHLRQSGFDVVVTREPGGSKGAEAVRHVLLSGAAQEFGPHAEALLFAAARQDHVASLIAPALAEGKIVLCDRFTDSTRAYQGGEGAISDAFLDSLDAVSLDGLRPDLTLLLDVPSQTGMNRAGERRGDHDIDRFEKDDLKIHEARRKVFLQLARAEPDRIVVIDASQPIDLVGENIWKTVEDKLAALPETRLAKPGDV